MVQGALPPDVKVRNARQVSQEWPLTTMNSLPAQAPMATISTTPPPGLTVLTKDGDAYETPLADVDIRVIRLTIRDGSVAIANSSTDANGTLWFDIHAAEHFIIVASKKGYLDTSSTYRYKHGERNVHTISMQKHSMRKEFTWTSGLDRLVEFRPRFKGVPYSFEIPAGSLDAPEQTNIVLKFHDVNTNDPVEMRKAPELIAAVDTPEGTTLISLAIFAMADLTIVNMDTDEPVDLMLPVEAEFPLSRKPRGTRQGSRISAWCFDKTTGVWRKGGVGKVRLDRFQEPMWSFEARHFTWWSAMQPWAGTSCVIVKTCFDKKCQRVASFIPVEFDGVDFSYSSSAVSSGEGRACAQFKMGGNVMVSSPFSGDPKLVEGNPISGYSCPPEYDTLVLSPPGQAQTGRCEEVVVVVRDPSETTEPPRRTVPRTTAEPEMTTTTEPATTIPMTTPTTLPPTPPPSGLQVLAMDSSAQQALLSDVQIRIIRPTIRILTAKTTAMSPMTTSPMTNSSITTSDVMTNSSMTTLSTVNSSLTNSSTVNDSLITASTTADGIALLDVPEDEPVIVVATKEGYISTSFTYSFQPGVKNVLPISIQKHPFTEQFVWMADEDQRVEFTTPDHQIPYGLEFPAGSLNITDGSAVDVLFFGVHTTTPAELKEVPELIGSVESSEGTKLIGLEALTMAEVTMVNSETNDLVDIVLPFEVEFPLDRKPRGVRHGSHIPAWYFDKTTGTWKEDGIGKVKRNKAGELFWSFQASHFTWWSAMQPWPETSCIIIKSCYEKNCKRAASFVPVEVHGVDFSFVSTSVTSKEGQTCTHFKMGGQVRVSSPCSKKPKFRTGELGGTTYCPENTQVLRPQDKTETGQCEQVVIVVKGKCPDWIFRLCR
ncbi:uncharacterized protein LOC129260685 [Lytechinus pictus]|uniref:uncharacterized protein LOC129260685 n=1 Tax=Lytechinus pictus TaxID=7653 RepID=UPI0030B9B5C1